MRKLLAAAILSSVLATADVAAAKGPDHLTLDGPGLAAPIVLRGDTEEAPFWTLSDQIKMWSAFDAPGPRASVTPVGLGPRYEIVWSMSYNPQGASVRQLLYPFAAGGPQVYTPGLQRLYDMPARPGWHPAAASLTVTLRELGIDASPSRPELARRSVAT
jgi:hypothetical protein